MFVKRRHSFFLKIPFFPKRRVSSSRLLRVRGDGRSRLLHVELGGALGLPVSVLSDRGVEALRVAADAADEQRVATPFSKHADVIALLHSRL